MGSRGSFSHDYLDPELESRTEEQEARRTTRSTLSVGESVIVDDNRRKYESFRFD